MKFIINNGVLMDAMTEWQARMGNITQAEFAAQIGGQLIEVPDTYKGVSIQSFSVNSNGVYSFSAQLHNEHINSKRMLYIRKKRNFECFRYINRGQLWYDSLSTSEKSQLQAWYSAWLELPNRADLNIENPQYPTPPAFLTDFQYYESILPEEAFL